MYHRAPKELTRPTNCVFSIVGCFWVVESVHDFRRVCRRGVVCVVGAVGIRENDFVTRDERAGVRPEAGEPSPLQIRDYFAESGHLKALITPLSL